MKSLHEYIIESSVDKALTFMDDVVKALTEDTDTWNILSDDGSTNDDIVDNMNEKDIYIHQDERKIEYNFKTNDNNSESHSLVQVVLYFRNGRISGDKFAINIEYLGNTTIHDYLDTDRYLGERLKDDEWNKRYSQNLYVYPCGTFTKNGLITLLKDLQQQHVDVAY